MQYGVGQLEELFFKSKADQKVLKQLENELQYRHVPRAVALLAEVQAAMFDGKDLGAPTPAIARPPQAPPRQPDLGARPTTPPMPAVPQFVPAPVRAPASTPDVATSPATAPLPPRAIPAMTVEDACKLLKATPGATWESIEQTRRLLVQQSSPSRTSTMSADKRAQALVEARRVNEAYAVLSIQRVGGR
jgi:hypothetical protein